ncbi:MAG: hypothetical protein NTW25_03740 [Candidatus Kapabacteria bacterium]|nr:hypothetical protein [Candidatus Kapabacteria bacterium]
MKFDLKPTPWAIIKKAEFKDDLLNTINPFSYDGMIEEWLLFKRVEKKNSYHKLIKFIDHRLYYFGDLDYKIDRINIDDEGNLLTGENKFILKTADEVKESIKMKQLAMTYTNFIYLDNETLYNIFMDYFFFDCQLEDIPIVYMNYAIRNFFLSKYNFYYTAPYFDYSILKPLTIDNIVENYKINKMITNSLEEFLFDENSWDMINEINSNLWLEYPKLN